MNSQNFTIKREDLNCCKFENYMSNAQDNNQDTIAVSNIMIAVIYNILQKEAMSDD